jgi:hypothetical protein
MNEIDISIRPRVWMGIYYRLRHSPKPTALSCVQGPARVDHRELRQAVGARIRAEPETFIEYARGWPYVRLASNWYRN